MKLLKSEERHIVTFSDGFVLGEVSAQLDQALTTIAEQQYHLEFEVFAAIKAIRDTLQRVSKGKDAVIRVQINIYGPRAIADAIGKELSQKKLYLQTPVYCRPDAKYHNPQFLNIVVPQASHPEEKLKSEECAAPYVVISLKETVNEVFSELTRNLGLREFDGDQRLRTPLLP